MGIRLWGVSRRFRVFFFIFSLVLGRFICLVKFWMMLCFDIWELMVKRRLSCFSMRFSIFWFFWLVKFFIFVGVRRETGGDGRWGF